MRRVPDSGRRAADPMRVASGARPSLSLPSSVSLVVHPFVSLFLLLFLLLFLFSSPASAQLRLLPQGGLYASVSDLGTVNTAEGIRRLGEQKASFAYGLTLELRTWKPIQWRLTGLYGSDSELPVGGIGCEGSACDLQSTVLMATAGAALSPFPEGSPVRPFLLAGGGLKKYDFEFTSGSQLEDALGDDSITTILLGIGFHWDLWILSGTVELADYISDSIVEGGDQQHDFFLTLGLLLG